ncbi:MAG: SusC/RagA family TonB-linked outer membrane protein [Longimicrobiales bacterium]
MAKACAAVAYVAAAVALLLLGAPQLSAQERAIRGTVTDAQTGQPLSGAQVSVRGTSIGTVTDATGRYLLLNVPEGTVQVRAEYIGYSAASQTVTVPVGESVVADFALAVTAIELEQIVATGYAEQTRREVSGAVSTLDAQELENVPAASLDVALQGKATGVQVTQNAGNPGNAITVRVRGSASITASNQPLYVVDGVPVIREDLSQLGLGGQDLSAITGINPNEIESLDILKDASAAAIYGSRGSNGVIMIRTKRGATGAPRITLNTYAGYQEAAKRLDLLNAAEFLEFFNAGAEFDGYGAGFFDEDFNTGVDTDWQEAVLRTAPVTNTQVSINGGTDRFKYYVSGTYFDQEGIIIGSAYDRASGRVNLDVQASDRLNLSASLALSQEDNDRVESDNSIESVVTNAIASEPYIPVRNPDGTYTGGAQGLSYANPVGVGLENDVNARTIRSFGNVRADYGLASWLRLTGRGGFDIVNLREREYQSPLVPLTYSSGVDGVSQSGYSQGRRYVLEGFLTADRSLLENPLSLTAGASVETNTRELNFVRGEGFTSPDLQQVGNAARVTNYDGTEWEHNLVSLFSRASYSFGDRYFLNASIRSDGSSRFGGNDRYGVFPSLSAAWALSAEPFFPDLEALNELRIRASWGVTGNEEIGDFEFLGLYGTSNYGDVPGTAPNNLPNPNLRWERTEEWNVGFDVAFFQERLGLIAEYYTKQTTDLLLNRPVTSTSGFTSVLANVGSLENRGWELSLRTVNLRPSTAGGLEWTSELNVTHNTNEVTGLFADEPFNTGLYSVNRLEVGQPLGAFHLLRFEGVDPQTGDAIYFDVPDETDDRVIVGSPHPDYFGGLRNGLFWRAFDLGVFLEFSQGAEIYNAMRRFADDGGYYYDNKFGDVMDYWRQPGDVTDTPRPSYDGTSGARLNSSRFVEDASYIRLQDITLGIRIPDRVANVLNATSARLYVSGKNLKTWSDYSGYAPDVNSNGASGSAALGTDFYAYPVARSFMIGFQGTW